MEQLETMNNNLLIRQSVEILKYKSLIVISLKQSFLYLYCSVLLIHRIEMGDDSISSVSDQRVLRLQL